MLRLTSVYSSVKQVRKSGGLNTNATQKRDNLLNRKNLNASNYQD